MENKPNTFQFTEKPREMPQVWGLGGGSAKQGVSVNVDSRFPVWESQNGRNAVHGTAGYSQHLGGPYGNSRPDFRGGIQFTRRF